MNVSDIRYAPTGGASIAYQRVVVGMKGLLRLSVKLMAAFGPTPPRPGHGRPAHGEAVG